MASKQAHWRNTRRLQRVRKLFRQVDSAGWAQPISNDEIQQSRSPTLAFSQDSDYTGFSTLNLRSNAGRR